MTLQEWLDDDKAYDLLIVDENMVHIGVKWVEFNNQKDKKNTVRGNMYYDTSVICMIDDMPSIKEAKLALLRKYKMVLQDQLNVLKEIEL